jgi:hypothetical protein
MNKANTKNKNSIPLSKCFDSNGKFLEKNLTFGNVSKEYKYNIRYVSMKFKDPETGRSVSDIQCILTDTYLQYNATSDMNNIKSAQVPAYLNITNPQHKMVYDFLVAFSNLLEAHLKSPEQLKAMGDMPIKIFDKLTKNVGIMSESENKKGKNGLDKDPVLTCIQIPLDKWSTQPLKPGETTPTSISATNPKVRRNPKIDKGAAYIIDLEYYKPFAELKKNGSSLSAEQTKKIIDNYNEHMNAEWTFDQLKTMLKAGSTIPLLCFHVKGGQVNTKSFKPQIQLNTLYFEKSDVSSFIDMPTDAFQDDSVNDTEAVPLELKLKKEE